MFDRVLSLKFGDILIHGCSRSSLLSAAWPDDPLVVFIRSRGVKWCYMMNLFSYVLGMMIEWFSFLLAEFWWAVGQWPMSFVFPNHCSRSCACSRKLQFGMKREQEIMEVEGSEMEQERKCSLALRWSSVISIVKEINILLYLFILNLQGCSNTWKSFIYTSFTLNHVCRPLFMHLEPPRIQLIAVVLRHSTAIRNLVIFWC